MGGRGSHGQAHMKTLGGALLIIVSLIFTGVHGGRSSLQTVGNSPWTDSEKVEEVEVPHEVYDSEEVEEVEVEVEVPHEVYTLGPKISDWDDQRVRWLEANPGKRLNRKGRSKVVLVTSSQSEACPSHAGDFYLLKFLKNKIDYARLHDLDIYYNMVVFEEKMEGFFVKLPLVRKLMLTHPEAEWVWWMDSDALFTDMSFEIPLEKYDDHNMVIHGWNGEVYDNRNWIGLNAGIFLLRNCQWSLDLLDIWAAMGEKYATHREEVGEVLTRELTGGRPDNFLADDQSALVYLLSTTHTAELKPKVFLENSFDLHGYWVMAMEKIDEKLREFPERQLGGKDLSFITHFVGCKTCAGSYASYGLDKCLEGMERAYNLADNQILQIYGYEHDDLSSPHVLSTRRLD